MKRKVVARAAARGVGAIDSPRLLGRRADQKPLIERLFIMASSACPAVADIGHQPKIAGLKRHSASSTTYTPDLVLDLGADGFIVAEVKPPPTASRADPCCQPPAEMDERLERDCREETGGGKK